MNTLYEKLGTTRAATKNEIRTAYILLAKKEHPDLGGTTASFAEAHEAYRTLNHNHLRAQYNAWLDDNYKPCIKCTGRGVVIKTKSFRERTVRLCEKCRGSGVGEKK